MKKIVLFCVAFSLSMPVLALNVKWQISKAEASQVGIKVFLVDAISDSWKSVDDVRSTAKSFADGTEATIIQKSRFVASDEMIATGDKVTVDSMAKAYLVLVDPKNSSEYKYTGVNMSEGVYDPQGQPKDVNLVEISSILQQGETGTFSHTDPTPEPTSGLLLLLGAAGLALRRRVK